MDINLGMILGRLRTFRNISIIFTFFLEKLKMIEIKKTIFSEMFSVYLIKEC